MKKQANKKVIGIGGALAAIAGVAALAWTKFGGNNEDDEVMELQAEDIVDADFEEVEA